MLTIQRMYYERIVEINFSNAPKIHTKVIFAPVYFGLRLFVL